MALLCSFKTCIRSSTSLQALTLVSVVHSKARFSTWINAQALTLHTNLFKMIILKNRMMH